MWLYEKKLQYPVRVCKKDLPMARFLLTQFGGPNFRFCKKKNIIF
jgi:spore coat protein JC